MVSAALASVLLLMALPVQADPAPAAAPARTAPDGQYRLAPGDKIRVNVFGEDTLSGEFAITSAGNLTFPLVGNVPATGQTVEQLQEALRTRLADGYIRDPKVSIQVVNFRPYYILGEVNRPGEYPASTGLTLEQAVAAAGGYTYRANTRSAMMKHATETSEKPVELRGKTSILIQAGDTIRIRERHF
jgi:polysaccharide biosynthesis/export protein